jgi:hypothetical protein
MLSSHMHVSNVVTSTFRHMHTYMYPCFMLMLITCCLSASCVSVRTRIHIHTPSPTLHDHGYLDFRLVITACKRRQAICIAVLLFSTVIVRQRCILIRSDVILLLVLPFILHVILVGTCCNRKNISTISFPAEIILVCDKKETGAYTHAHLLRHPSRLLHRLLNSNCLRRLRNPRIPDRKDCSDVSRERWKVIDLSPVCADRLCRPEDRKTSRFFE